MQITTNILLKCITYESIILDRKALANIICNNLHCTLHVLWMERHHKHRDYL